MKIENRTNFNWKNEFNHDLMQDRVLYSESGRDKYSVRKYSNSEVLFKTKVLSIENYLSQ